MNKYISLILKALICLAVMYFIGALCMRLGFIEDLETWLPTGLGVILGLAAGKMISDKMKKGK